MLSTTKEQARLLVKRAVISSGLEVSSALAYGLGLLARRAGWAPSSRCIMSAPAAKAISGKTTSSRLHPSFWIRPC